MQNLNGKTALVIGASSGIGLHAALSLARSGATVGISGRQLEKLEEVSKQASEENLTLIPVPMDVRKIADIHAGIDSFVNGHQGIDILVYAAGIATHAPAFEMTEQAWDDMLSTNLKGAFFAAQKAAQDMEKRRWGRIIFLSSILSGGTGSGVAEQAHYCASKGGIIGLTEALAVEFASIGITVNTVAPGYIETPMNQQLKDDPVRFQAKINRIPLKRFGKPEEIANYITFIASPDSSYMTGSTIYVDGGWLAG